MSGAPAPDSLHGVTTVAIPSVPIFGFGAAIGGAAVMLAWRFRESQRAVTARSILIPPLGMSTGFCMFLAPPLRVPLSWALVALAAGALVFAIPLQRSSRLTLRDGAVYMQRSPAFLWILVGLVAVRLLLRSYVEHLVSPLQTGALFYLLAFGMIVRWRVQMYLAYRRLTGAAPAR